MLHDVRVLWGRAFSIDHCILVAISVALASTVADARPITATARIFCPASIVPGTEHIDTTFARPIVNVPCAGIRVLAMDADPLTDEVCGTAFTDSGGRVTIRGDCGDDVHPAPELYLKVEARSVNRFSVGVVPANVVENILEDILQTSVGIPPPLTHAIALADDLRQQQIFEWIAPVNNSGNFGDLFIGAGGATSFMAARQFWVAQFTTNRLLAGTRFPPMEFKYNLNAPFGTPTTLYDAVILDGANNSGADAARALRATPHEIGHVLYNTYHSDFDHWLGEAAEYARNHRICDTDKSQRFAWYEGFAQFVRDYVFQRWDWNRWTWALNFQPFGGCAFTTGARSMSVEGNAQGLLNNIFFGPVRPALSTMIRSPSPTSFSCPPGQSLVGSSAGGTHVCEAETAVSCMRGRLSVDGDDVVDQCVIIATDPACLPCPPDSRNCEPECEPAEQRIAAGCAGRVEHRPGPDACFARRPATPIAGPPEIPVLGCGPGETFVPVARPAPFGGASQCEREAPIGCLQGALVLDGDGAADQCVSFVESAACQAERRRRAASGGDLRNFRCEDLEEVTRPANCRAGAAVRRAGRDSCLERLPGLHALPNGRVRQRPDGSPDVALGLDAGGMRAWFDLPNLDDLVGWVRNAGTSAHRANEFWSGWIRPWCVGRSGPRLRYCDPVRSTSFTGELRQLDPALN